MDDPQDFNEWITYFGFDFISDLSFGSRFRLLEDPEHRYLPDLLKWTSHFVYYVSIGMIFFSQANTYHLRYLLSTRSLT